MAALVNTVISVIDRRRRHGYSGPTLPRLLLLPQPLYRGASLGDQGGDEGAGVFLSKGLLKAYTKKIIYIYKNCLTEIFQNTGYCDTQERGC